MSPMLHKSVALSFDDFVWGAAQCGIPLRANVIATAMRAGILLQRRR
ncbi:MAG: hypothetical protein ACRD0K_21620 [Egibacteraceae bacterium]